MATVVNHSVHSPPDPVIPPFDASQALTSGLTTSSIPLPASTRIAFPNALNNPDAEPKITYHIGGQTLTDQDANGWELRASRRALANLKTLLFEQPMLDLIKRQCEEGDAYYKALLAASKGRWRECRTDLHVQGVNLGVVMGARSMLLAMSRENRALRALLPLHPEHYAVPQYEGQEGMIEVIGEHMARLRIIATDDVPDFVLAYGDPAFPAKKPKVCRLEDGAIVFYILHEFRDVDSGCELRLRLIFPAEAPDVMFAEHAEHLAIEFRTGIKTFYAWSKGTET